MKKTLNIMLCLIVMLVLTGCGCSKSYDVECSKSYEESGVKYEVLVGGNTHDGKVTEITMEMTFEDKSTAKTMYNVISTQDKNNKYTLEGDTIKVFSLLEESNQSTKEEFVKEFESQEYTCK